MYFGEALTNYYFENTFNNDITLLNELFLAEVGKFIIQKLKEFWKKILELIKFVKSKITEFINKISKKNKKLKNMRLLYKIKNLLYLQKKFQNML